jgi:hypothetical protein
VDEREERRERREVEDAVARRRGKPVVMERGGAGGPSANLVRHDYAVRNAGQAPISEIWLWIEDAEGKVVSARSGGQIALVAGDPVVHMTVDVPQPLPEEPIRLMVRWTDADGTRTEPTGIHPRRHM